MYSIGKLCSGCLGAEALLFTAGTISGVLDLTVVLVLFTAVLAGFSAVLAGGVFVGFAGAIWPELFAEASALAFPCIIGSAGD